MTIGKNGAMQMSTQKKKQTPIEKLAALIVDKRKAFYLFYIIAGIFCAISTGWTKVNNDITSYLPDSSETRIGLDLMNDQFVTYGSGSIMLDNVTFEKAEEIASELEKIDGVTSVTVENDEDSYKNGSALLSVTFDGEEDDQISKDAMKAVKEKLEPYDEYINSAVGNSSSETIAAEMQTVVVIVLVIIIGVLFFTSHTYMEIPVLLMTFGHGGSAEHGHKLHVRRDLLRFKLHRGSSSARARHRLRDNPLQPIHGRTNRHGRPRRGRNGAQ